MLISTDQPCGAGINGGAVSDFNVNKPGPITGNDGGGGEDFDAAAFGMTFNGVTCDAGPANVGPSTSEVLLAAEIVWTGGEGSWGPRPRLPVVFGPSTAVLSCCEFLPSL
ncbi:MAG: hypothetical protein OER95_09345 [Acidimicrobiia bacterium]|nr:hypothetical protein [Acidimicrobiia bacterium]